MPFHHLVSTSCQPYSLSLHRAMRVEISLRSSTVRSKRGAPYAGECQIDLNGRCTRPLIGPEMNAPSAPSLNPEMCHTSGLVSLPIHLLLMPGARR